MSSDTSANKSSSAMSRLLAKHKNLFKVLHKGETVKGTLTKVTSHEILVDVDAKTEAVVLEKDREILHTILTKFKVGDTVEVSVLNPESDFGHPVVSLRRYLSNLAWGKLEALEKSKEMIEATISETVKNGYIVTTDFGISGFLPQMYVSFSDGQMLGRGSRVNVSVLELDRRDNKIIFSQKTQFTDDDFAKVSKQFTIGQTVKATVANVALFGVFVTVPLKTIAKGMPEAIEGFIHTNEVAWERVDDLTAVFAPGDTIEAIITRFDSDTKRLTLSVKRLTQDPFEKLLTQFPVDSRVNGTISAISDAGISVAFGEDVAGFIKKEKIPPTVTYTIGQKITATVSEFDKKRRRINLIPVLLEKPIGYR